MISVGRWVRITSFLFALLIVALVAGRAAAQDITGALQGTVVSPEGKPEPEVRVSVTGPYLQGSRETTTDRSGFFQFLALPPGTYALRVTRIGLRALEVRDIVVELGRTTAVGPLTLETQPIELKPVEVQAHALSIDPVHTTAGGTLKAKDYAALPVERDYKSIIAVLPQINDSHRGDPLNVAGSTGLENQYYIDGVNVTDARFADRATSLPYDFVREVEVKSGGYEAQYGRALGAIVNAVTYSGTDDVEGSVFGFTQPGQWAASPREAPVQTESDPMSYDYGARVSGPIRRGQLWYSAALNPRVDQVDREVPGIGIYPDKTSAVRFATKLTWRTTPKTRVELSVFGDPTVRDVVLTPVAGITKALNPDPLLGRIESGGVTGSLRATLTPTPRLLLQASLASQWARYSDKAATVRGQSEPIYADWVTGTVGDGYNPALQEDRDRASVTLRGTITLPGHTLVTGFDYEDARVKSECLWRANFRFDDTTYMAGLEQYQGTFHNRSPAAYLQDSWRVTDRVTLNAGLRWSGQYLVGASGRTAQRITDEWQPRAGFSWQPGRAGTQRIFGSYGRFYQMIPANLAVMMFVDYTAIYSYYSTDPRQPDAIPFAVLDGSSLESYFAHQITGLHAENFDEFTLGYERLLGAHSKLTARGMYRDLRSSYQWGEDHGRTDNIFVLGTPGEGDFSYLPPPKREYTSLEVAAEGDWRGLGYRASYVLSRNWGNYPGLYDSDGGFTNPGKVTTFESPYQAENSTGYLPNDHTHVAKLSLTHTAGFGLSTGAFLTFETGAPVNDFAAVPTYLPIMPAFLVQRGTAGRTPTLWNLDLRLAYPFPPVRDIRARLYVDVLHVGNPRGTTRVEELHYPTPDRTQPNPMYKQPLAYQPPMAARMGVQVGF
jgi:hypothetical protein